MKIKQNEVIEAKKQTALYTELIKKRNDPYSIYMTSPTSIDPEVQEEIYSLSLKPKRKGYWNNLGKKFQQEIDSEINSSSKLLSLSKRGKELNPGEYEYEHLEGGEESNGYAEYYDQAKRGRQIYFDRNRGSYGSGRELLQEDEVMSDAINLLKRNKDRLKLLDEIEDPNLKKLGQLIDSVDFGGNGGNKNRYEEDRNEGLNELRNRYFGDYSDSLIEKISSNGFTA